VVTKTKRKTAAVSKSKRKAAPVKPASKKVAAKPSFDLSTSRQFPEWLAERRASLAFTTYQAGKLFFIGLGADGRLSIFERSLDRCMGLVADGNSLFLSTLYQLWRFENALDPGSAADGYDRVYVPQLSYVTGDLDIHDIAVDADGRLVFVNTLFSCLATVSETHSFVPLWRPPFLSKLAAEDRCHLNGLAMRDGQPGWVTAVSESDVADGWRDQRRNGGCVVDVQEDEVVVRGLSMPHSPRWRDDRLWLLNSGTGEFGFADLKSGRFEPVCFCPGYLRGLAFIDGFAIVGLSLPRENRAFGGLPIDNALTSKKAKPRCGLQVIDLQTGDVVHWVRIEGVVSELYDVVTLPGAVRPMAIGLQTDEIRRVISVGEALAAPS
jgi:uncharacterized protein (TIGR03032 family)